MLENREEGSRSPRKRRQQVGEIVRVSRDLRETRGVVLKNDPLTTPIRRGWHPSIALFFHAKKVEVVLRKDPLNVRDRHRCPLVFSNPSGLANPLRYGTLRP